MNLSRIGQRRQITIPKDIFEDMHLKEGDYIEIARLGEDGLILKKKKIIDIDQKNKGALPPAPSYEERMAIMKLLEANATDDNLDIPIDKIIAARKSKKKFVALDSE